MSESKPPPDSQDQFTSTQIIRRALLPSAGSAGDSQNALQEFGADEVIFVEGAQSDLAYIVREGTVHIMKSVGGQAVRMQEIKAGEMFGEMALITGNPRSATAVSGSSRTVLEIIDRLGFARLMQSDSDFAIRTLKRLAGMTADSQAKLLATFGPEGSGTAASAKARAAEADAFAPDYLRIEAERLPPIVKYSAWGICVFLASVLLWSIFAHLDTAVTGTGKVISTVQNITLQPVESADEAQRLGFRGSPTILVDGRDPWADSDAPVGLSCRVFQTDSGLAGLPSDAQLAKVLREAAAG